MLINTQRQRLTWPNVNSAKTEKPYSRLRGYSSERISALTVLTFLWEDTIIMKEI